jgi:hypothetical protein
MKCADLAHSMVAVVHGAHDNGVGDADNGVQDDYNKGQHDESVGPDYDTPLAT